MGGAAFERGGRGPRSYAVAAAGTGLATALLAPLRGAVNPTTDALVYLTVVLFAAARYGKGPAVAASALAMLCFNFFFLPPYHTLTISDPQNWVALAAFVVTAVTAGELSSRARRRAEEAESSRAEVERLYEEAEAGRREIERLYAEMREAFDRASRAEALRQAEQMKSALLDAVTHDLRTPLTSIKVSVSTLLDEPGGGGGALDPETRLDMLEVIDEETDRLDRFVGNLVELARIEAGEMHLRRGWVSVADVVGRAADRAGRVAGRHRLEVSVPDDLPAIRADGQALAEAVYTLVENSAKYSPPGSRIRVGALAAGDRVVISVEDEGPGVPEALRERVFEKFFRYAPEGAAAAGQPAGTGMGLAIAKGIVCAHDGRIWIGAGPDGRGSVVSVELPVGEAGEEASPERPAGRRAVPAGGEPAP